MIIDAIGVNLPFLCFPLLTMMRSVDDDTNESIGHLQRSAADGGGRAMDRLFAAGIFQPGVIDICINNGVTMVTRKCRCSLTLIFFCCTTSCFVVVQVLSNVEFYFFLFICSKFQKCQIMSISKRSLLKSLKTTAQSISGKAAIIGAKFVSFALQFDQYFPFLELL